MPGLQFNLCCLDARLQESHDQVVRACSWLVSSSKRAPQTLHAEDCSWLAVVRKPYYTAALSWGSPFYGPKLASCHPDAEQPPLLMESSTAREAHFLLGERVRAQEAGVVQFTSCINVLGWYRAPFMQLPCWA